MQIKIINRNKLIKTVKGRLEHKDKVRDDTSEAALSGRGEGR